MKTFFRYSFFFLFMGTMLCACSFKSGHTEFTITPMKTGNNLHLAQKNIYITMPHELSNNTSDQQIPSIIQAVLQGLFEKYSPTVVLAQQYQLIDQSIETAKKAASNYLVWVEILDWYDPPASLQIDSDKAEINISLYDVQTGTLLQIDNLSCNGSATTINLIGAYSPKDCLQPALEKWFIKIK